MHDHSFTPRWHALNRESQLTAQLLATGVTALGRANYAQKEYYAQAFFELANGFERMAKMIIVIEHIIRNQGAFPHNSMLKRIGHDLDRLLERCEQLSAQFRASEKYAERPSDPIHAGIVKTLGEFAKASRYYNLDLIAQPSPPPLAEPVSAWWSRVGEPILAKHYSKGRRDQDERRASALGAMLRDVMLTRHHDETEALIDDPQEAILRSSQATIVQRYGRLYCLQIIRWLTYLLWELVHVALKKRLSEVPYLYEPFGMFMNDDAYLRSRKTWSTR